MKKRNCHYTFMFKLAFVLMFVFSLFTLLSRQSSVFAEHHWDLDNLSSKKISYGCSGKNVTDENVPNDALNAQEKFGKYHAAFIGDTSKKIIYLTFDEGYEAGYTPIILDILKENQVPAIFFITKQFLDSNPELVQRMIEEGHIVGNHTCRHPAGGMTTLSLTKTEEDVKKLNQLVYNQFGYTMKLFRFPEGVYSEQLLGLMDNLGFQSVFWSFAYKDFDRNHQPDSTTALEKLIARLHPGAIYLLHAVSKTNTEILDEFIDQARAAGYVFGDFPME